jgi:DNA-binding PadR family transcriptional regulator
MMKNEEKVIKKSMPKITLKVSSKSTQSTSKLVPKYIELRGFLSFFILHELENTPSSGDELARVVGSRKNTVLTPGTIYPALKRLRRQKLVLYRRDGRKKIYFLTDLGKRELKALYIVFNEVFIGLKKKMK